MSALLETSHGDTLSGFAEAARDACKEGRLVFARDYVQILGSDSAQTVFFTFKLSKGNIMANGEGKYHCTSSNIEVGVDTRMLASCLSGVSVGDLVGFEVDTENDPDRLTIRCQNPQTGKKACWRVLTPELPEDSFSRDSIDQLAYNNEIVVSSLLFHDMLRDLTKSDATDISICCDGERLVLVANGRNIRADYELHKGKDPSNFQYTPKSSDRWPVIECFAMSLLQKVSKAKSVAPFISICLQPNFPVSFSYKTAIGTMTHLITPRENEEWLENPDSRCMPPRTSEIKGIPQRQRSINHVKPTTTTAKPNTTTQKKRSLSTTNTIRTRVDSVVAHAIKKEEDPMSDSEPMAKKPVQRDKELTVEEVGTPKPGLFDLVDGSPTVDEYGQNEDDDDYCDEDEEPSTFSDLEDVGTK